MAFSPDGRRIVTGSWDDTAKVWNAATGEQLLTLDGHADAIVSVGFFPDGGRIVTGSHDRTAKVWEAATGQELLTLEHGRSLGAVAVSPDGKRIVTGGWDDTAKMWKAASPAQVTAWQKEERSESEPQPWPASAFGEKATRTAD